MVGSSMRYIFRLTPQTSLVTFCLASFPASHPSMKQASVLYTESGTSYLPAMIRFLPFRQSRPALFARCMSTSSSV